MRVVVAGGHGQIALLLTELLVARGDEVVGIIRNPAHASDLRGGTPAVVDLESAAVSDVAAVLRGADAAVFAAGAGPGSGAARKDTVDRGAAVLFADACSAAGVRRHVQISAMGLDRADAMPPDDVFAAYLRAKAAAEDDLRRRDLLDWTILRPGRLTDDPPAGRVQLADHVGRGPIPRADVAAVLAALLSEPRTAGRTLELVSGETPVDEAVAALASA